MKKEQLAQIEQQFAQSPLEDHITRIADMNSQYENPSAHGLGIHLALLMAQEIQNQLPLGSKSGALVASWSSEYSSGLVEEAVLVARQFLLEPETLKSSLEKRLVESGNESSEV